MDTKLFNIKELDRVFDGLKDGSQRSVIISALRRASKPILADAKSNLRSDTKIGSGNLINCIGVITMRKVAGIQVGVRKTAPWKAWYGRLINSGTKERFRKTKSGVRVSTGKLDATNFFTDAYNKNTNIVADDFSNQMIISFDKFIKRKLKK